ncbi:hypothetical protein, partial [Enterobacter intestinihominis]
MFYRIRLNMFMIIRVGVFFDFFFLFKKRGVAFGFPGLGVVVFEGGVSRPRPRPQQASELIEQLFHVLT